jgi:hypothetical protein
MGDGTKLAIAIMILLIAGICFFFAFHPNGVDLDAYGNNPDGILQFLIGEFNETATGADVNGPTNSGAVAGTSGNPAVSNPAGQQSQNLTNIPGTNQGPTVNPGVSQDVTNVPGSNIGPVITPLCLGNRYSVKVSLSRKAFR